MAHKVIKKGSSDAEQAKRYPFESNSDPSDVENLELDEWTDSSREESQVEEPDPLETEPSPVDIALLEKNAYESGLQEGERSGREKADNEVKSLMSRFAEAISEIGRVRSSLYAQVEGEVVKLAIQVAKKIVHREIQADPEIIQTLVSVALNHVAEKSSLTVHLNPVDHNYLVGHRAKLAQRVDRSPDIVLLADEGIERGGCLIQTDCGDVDARIEEEFREVERNFFASK